MKIERVFPEDAEEILAIYAPYVSGTAVSFEYEVPSLEEFRNRIIKISASFPYIKAVEEGQILGYAYADCFKNRSAFDWSVETTIYLRADIKRRGIGRKLYEQLERSLGSMGVLNLNACIAVPKGEDPYLTDDSIRFHEKMGYSHLGIFHDSGYKFGRWYNMEWMEKMLGDHTSEPGQVLFGKWKL